MRLLILILFFPVLLWGQGGTTQIPYAPSRNLAKFDSTVFGISPNYSVFWKDGTLRAYGEATAWDDLFFPFQTGISGVASYPAFVPDSGYWNFSAVDTTGPSQCIKYFQIQLPHRWALGTRIYPHIHYKHETAVGTPKFVFKYKWINTMGQVPAAWNWYYMNLTTGTVNNTEQIVYNTTGIDGTGKTLSSILIGQVFLYAAPVNVKAYQFDIHIAVDSYGSRTEYIK